jgi:hypothetical protein
METKKMEIKNFGVIRGGGNSHARLFIHIEPSQDATKEEIEAIFSLWQEEFGIKGYNWCGWCLAFNIRREFAVLPYILRKCEKLGYAVSTSMWDVGIEGQVYSTDIDFWKVVAMAQAFCSK